MIRMTTRAAVRRIAFPAALLLAAHACAAASGGAYDPLDGPAGFTPRTLELTVADSARRRDIPVRVYLPATTAPAPVVLFSHGLGGARDNNPYLGTHWAARGYVVVFMQHAGSDSAVWKTVRPAQRMAALRAAADAQNLLLRIKDVPAVIDALGRWNAEPGHALAGRLDLKHIGMSGHSFGAVTTQAVSGQHFFAAGMDAGDPRIKAAVAFSPSGPRAGEDPLQAFGAVRIPWLLMTGTDDKAPIGNIDVASRLMVFPALPAGGKYELVLDGAEHSAFGDGPLPGERGARNPNHHRAILAISTAFWDAWLKDDAAARAWLDGGGPRSVLEAKDRWQRK